MELVDSQHGGGLGAPEPNPNFLSGPCNVGILKYYGNFNPTTCQGMSGGDWHAPSYTWALSDKFRDGGIVYFKIAHGYQAGGLNNQIREQAYQSFLPEKTTEFESGIKVDWTLGGMPVRTNVDAFYGHADNKQEVENGAYADGTQWIAVFNAGSLSYFGADVDAEVYLTRYLKLSADYTHINASYDNFVFPAIGILPQTNLTGASPAHPGQHLQRRCDLLLAFAGRGGQGLDEPHGVHPQHDHVCGHRESVGYTRHPEFQRRCRPVLHDTESSRPTGRISWARI